MGSVHDFEVGKPVEYAPGQFYLVKKPDGSFVALWAKGTHQGCNVPWDEGFVFGDPKTGESKAGWFREPFDERCHGSTWDAYGVRVFGPAPRNLDQFPVEVKGNQVYVRAVKQLLIRGDRPR
jgi:Rieske Fe-S protein